MLYEETGDINVVIELREREQQGTRNDQNATNELSYPTLPPYSLNWSFCKSVSGYARFENLKKIKKVKDQKNDIAI